MSRNTENVSNSEANQITALLETRTLRVAADGLLDPHAMFEEALLESILLDEVSRKTN